MARADRTPRFKPRLGVIAFVAAIHIAAVFALIHAFAPNLAAGAAREVIAAFTVTVSTPPPPPPQAKPAETRAPERSAGAAGEAGRKATPREAAAPVPRIVLTAQPAPPVAGQGTAVTSGARDEGSGSGAGGSGSGPGAGGRGSGAGGGGGAAKAVKIAGEINSARDYPQASREQRIGDHVIVALTVGVDGRVQACRVHRASRDPQADQITCRLATERFRFRPATDASGAPVPSTYGWRQSWYDPREKN